MITTIPDHVPLLLNFSKHIFIHSVQLFSILLSLFKLDWDAINLTYGGRASSSFLNDLFFVSWLSMMHEMLLDFLS